VIQRDDVPLELVKHGQWRERAAKVAVRVGARDTAMRLLRGIRLDAVFPDGRVLQSYRLVPWRDGDIIRVEVVPA
jgi:hypothetical protein